MNRFTKKSNSIIKAIEYQLIDEKENLSANEGIKKIPVLATNKLGQLENIEEELGIDFITMFRALKYGIYCFTSQKQLTHNYVRLVSNDIGVGVRDKVSYSFMTIFGEQILLFEDYGKTWALTEEELGNVY